MTLYEGGDMSERQVAQATGLFVLTVHNILKRRGVSGRRDSALARIACNRSFFRTVDSEASAYMLGFIAADGNVFERGSRPAGLQITLATRDRDHLLRLRDLMGSAHKLYDHSTPLNTHQCHWVVTSVELAKDLAYHGITPRKSATHSWPSTVPDHLLRHYVRGYFDGDGSAYVTLPKGYVTPQCRMVYYGTPMFLTGLRDYLTREVRSGAVNLTSTAAPTIKFLSYGGNRQVAALARHLYTNATVFLPRKRAVLSHLLEVKD